MSVLNGRQVVTICDTATVQTDSKPKRNDDVALSEKDALLVEWGYESWDEYNAAKDAAFAEMQAKLDMIKAELAKLDAS